MSELYCSSVEGHAVTRYGSTGRVAGVPQPGLLIGAERDPADPSRVVWYPDRIVCIPAQEATTYRREYRRAVEAKALKQHTKDEYEQQQAKQREAEKQAAERASAPAAPSPAPAPTTAPAQAQKVKA